jgi:lipooligosaccharide transport system permease protein
MKIMNLPTHRALKVWKRNFLVYLTHYRPSLVGNIGEPLLYLFAMGYGIGGYLQTMNGISYTEYIAPGLMVTSAMYSSVFECTFGSYTRMTVQRTYESVISTPVSLADVVLGEILWGMTKALISSSVMALVMMAFGLYTPGLGSIGLFVTIAMTGFLFSASAICFSAEAPSYEFFNYFFTLFIAPMFFLSGVFFPLDNFHVALRWASLAMPATHSVNLARWFFHGSGDAGLAYSALFLVTVGTGLAVLAVRLVRKRIVI